MLYLCMLTVTVKGTVIYRWQLEKYISWMCCTCSSQCGFLLPATISPYCVVSTSIPLQKKRTSMMKKTSDPFWNEYFTLWVSLMKCTTRENIRRLVRVVTNRYKSGVLDNPHHIGWRLRLCWLGFLPHKTWWEDLVILLCGYHCVLGWLCSRLASISIIFRQWD